MMMLRNLSGDANLKPPAKELYAITSIAAARSSPAGGESKQQFIRKWLREKDIQRSERELEQVTREKQGFDYARWTFYVAVGALIAAIVGIIVTVLHV
jgi:hypothetical protein